ncbi:nuclease-related domain-containing protein [Lysinibacillus sp. Bpr_S20]|uniref:nuclease-related domain-containing protein n=1 Tax=Lysinibacillus sp. Bpr_S20 TaxID=2933964 RepID=UPI00201226BF|nr:nuclease-related domain-containing protein [Lysinibacillus sp. Bpr_S20]MCL1699882.1 NERD domain-containing protein [Lysinibacillus sp. Bpr_S20]
MIIKSFAPSPLTTGLQALVNRLQPTHPQYHQLQQELKNKEAGDYGEQYVMKELQQIALLNDCYILHNVTLPSVLPMQIDILLIVPNAIILLEIKNIRGIVHFKNDPRQLIRTSDSGEVHVFTHPEVQLEQYMQGVKHFFNTQQVSIPIYGAVVFPFNNVNIHREDGRLPIIMAKELPIFLHKHLETSKETKTMADIKNIILSHLKHRTPFPLCTYYQIDASALQRGVYCENCGRFGMQKLRMTWHCQSCKFISKNAHIRALLDYYMLVGDTITNRNCREFLNVESQYVAKRLLQKLNLSSTGPDRIRKYHLSSIYWNSPQKE